MIIKPGTAQLAKEKGFNRETEEYWANYYTGFPPLKWKLVKLKCLSLNMCEFPAPKQGELQKWLREIHNIHIYVEPVWKSQEDVDNNQKPEYCPWISYYKFEKSGKEEYFDTYEEALESGLIESLKIIEDVY